MRKPLIALLLCLVLVGTIGATTAVTAEQMGQSSIQQFDVSNKPVAYPGWPILVVGKLTINMDTRHYVANAHGYKEYAGWSDEFIWAVVPGTSEFIVIGSATITNGGTIHWEGTLTQEQLDWINTWGSDAVFCPAHVLP